MILFTLAALAAQSTTADTPISVSSINGAMLADECSKHAGLELDACVGYILGVSDGLQISRITCRPYSEAATLQTVTIVRRYIHDHPEKWGWHPSALVREALVNAFPCPGRNGHH